jgi:two-component system, OmpR family, sensor histidine kinase BaeS
MTDPPAAAPAAPPAGQPGRSARGDTLGLRLAVAFIGVALVALALLAGLIVAFTSADVSSLVRRQRGDLTGAIADAAAAGWTRHSSWAGADLSPALDLASRTGSEAQIRDYFGIVVAQTHDFRAGAGSPQMAVPVLTHGHRIGEAIVRFTSSGLGSADSELRSALLQALTLAAGLAALLALVTGLAVALRLTRPVGHMITVTRARGAGVRTVRVGPVRAPQEIAELAGAFDDMAEQLDRQEQLRRDLVADVAHELRTPIAILLGGHEALLDGLAEPTPDELGSLRDEVLRLARMVDDLQTLAAADAAALQLELRPCDLAQVAAAAADSLASRFSAAGLQLERSMASAGVLGDKRWLHQVATNLLTNALKFSPAGGSVMIETGLDGGTAMMRVTDHGMGIPAAELPHIFNRFWRGRQAAQTSGSGIGLAVAAEIAHAHGGRLGVTSEPGQGTTMTLTVPAAAVPAVTGPAVTGQGPGKLAAS